MPVQTFNYTGTEQEFVVPVGVTELVVDMAGAAGGNTTDAGISPGLGGRVQCTIPVTPGESLKLYVGQVGHDALNSASSTATAYNGGGSGGGRGSNGNRGGGSGGGASDVRRGGSTTADRILVAGGGGGEGGWGYDANLGGSGGHGGGTTGEAGDPSRTRGNLGGGGGGGTGAAGGAAGTHPSGTAPVPTAGALAVGGNGGRGHFQYGGGAGGGGGGYYGGGGGGSADNQGGGAGGGGGSSYVDGTATGVTHTQGFQSGSGYITFTWTSGSVIEHLAAVAFNAEATMTPLARREYPLAVAFEATTEMALTGTKAVTMASVTFAAKARVAFVTRIVGDQWRLVAVDMDGTPQAEIENATVTGVVDELGTEGALEFALPVMDAKASKLPPMQEVQVWKGDTLLKWGPVFRPQANSRTLGFTGAGLEWYFSRRHFGKADRTNYLPNGDFENGMAGWRPGFAYYSNVQAPPVHEITKFPTMTGKRALRMTGAADGHDTFADVAFLWEVDETLSPEGDRFTAVAYVYVESYLGPANESRGLMLERISTTEPHPDAVLAAMGHKKSLEHVYARIDEDTPTGQWIKLEAVLTTPPKAGEPEYVRVTLYPPHGTAVYDRASLVLDEATRFYGIDQAQIAEGIVQHLQDPAYDKTDLLIGTNCQPTGVLRDRVYLHAEHENGKGALDELATANLDDGLEYSVEITPTSKVFTTHYPQKGVDHLDLVLEYGKNVEDFNWGFDGAVASNQVIALGSGDGSAREEGVATDLTALEGVSLEEVYVVTEGADISSLDNRAAARLEVIKNPVILELFLKDTTLAGVLRTGDRVTCRVNRGYVQVDARYRVIRTVLDPSRDKMSVVVNLYYEDA